MKNLRWLLTFCTLALAVVLVSAEISWAQCWGNGPRWRDQVSQNEIRGRSPGQGRGPGYVNCAGIGGGYGYCAYGQGNYTRGSRGPRRGATNNSPNSQTTIPQATQ